MNNPSYMELRLLAAAALIVCLPLLASKVAAQPAGAITNPAAIDQAVERFTGFPAGEIGGARMPADRRLRLAACNVPLDVEWHGTSRSTVRVSCTGPESWRIFIATRAAPQSAQTAPTISRGDPITVVVRGQGFTVQQTGEAMENGVVGEWIAIRTARDTSPVRARIERPGLAVIPSR